MTPLRAFAVALSLAILALCGSHRAARADEIAPGLELLELHQRAITEGKRLVSGLAPSDQRRLVGLYVAFDPSASDPSAMASCDDDGDYVIVVSDAMLRLLSSVARAQSADDEGGSRNVEDYATFLGRSQIPGNRLLPPPSGFFDAEKAGAAHETRLREAIAFVLARELAHLRAGDLVCAHPTATHESGDDVWTAAEQRRALEMAGTLYPGRGLDRDAEATTRVTDAGRTEQGALGLLRFFTQLELERTLHGSRFRPTYLAQHPSSLLRAAAVKTAAKNHPKD